MQLQGAPARDRIAEWREAWHPETVQVWGRATTEGAEDCEAIRWLHEPYRKGDARARIPEGTIYQTSVTGQVSEISRLWHRMYPVVLLKKNPQAPDKPIPRKTNHYLELLTLFPDDSNEFCQFLNFLESQQRQFTKLWPIAK